MSITVYRIQDKDGRGPWKHGFSHKWSIDRPRSDYRKLRPMTEEFPSIKFPKKSHCGAACKTKKQLKEWFLRQEYFSLVSYGYQAVEMNVQKILAESDIQVVISRNTHLSKNVRPFDLYKDMCVKHRYNTTPNSVFKSCPYCEIEAANH